MNISKDIFIYVWLSFEHHHNNQGIWAYGYKKLHLYSHRSHGPIGAKCYNTCVSPERAACTKMKLATNPAASKEFDFSGFTCIKKKKYENVFRRSHRPTREYRKVKEMLTVPRDYSRRLLFSLALGSKPIIKKITNNSQQFTELVGNEMI